MINLAFAAALLVTAAVQGPTSTAVDAAVTAQRSVRTAPANPAQRVCVQADTTGSRIPRMICRTRAEWDRAGGLPTDDR